MALMTTPLCEFGLPAPSFKLRGIDGQWYQIEDVQGPFGLLVMFICNHCPYVKAIRKRLIVDIERLMEEGIGCVAINANDPLAYPEDSFDKMKMIAQQYQYPFPYLWDEDQAVAQSFGAICTPDFFGYDSNLKLQYRGRFDDAGMNTDIENIQHDLLEAMLLIKKTGRGPETQFPSQGCSIKWKS